MFPAAQLLELIGQYLVTAGLVGGETNWTLAIGWKPPTPDRVVVLTEYGGRPPDVRPRLDRQSIQVWVRGGLMSEAGAYTEARRKIEDIRGALHGADITDLVAVTALQSVLPLGVDSGNNWEFACNFEVLTTRE